MILTKQRTNALRRLRRLSERLGAEVVRKRGGDYVAIAYKGRHLWPSPGSSDDAHRGQDSWPAGTIDRARNYLGMCDPGESEALQSTLKLGGPAAVLTARYP